MSLQSGRIPWNEWLFYVVMLVRAHQPIIMLSSMCVCVRVLDVPAGVTQEEGYTEFLIHLLSAVRALIFLARRIQPFVSLVDREVKFCVLTI